HLEDSGPLSPGERVRVRGSRSLASAPSPPRGRAGMGGATPHHPPQPQPNRGLRPPLPPWGEGWGEGIPLPRLQLQPTSRTPPSPQGERGAPPTPSQLTAPRSPS